MEEENKEPELDKYTLSKMEKELKRDRGREST